jgi:hypothetical protein
MPEISASVAGAFFELRQECAIKYNRRNFITQHIEKIMFIYLFKAVLYDSQSLE